MDLKHGVIHHGHHKSVKQKGKSNQAYRHVITGEKSASAAGS